MEKKEEVVVTEETPVEGDMYDIKLGEQTWKGKPLKDMTRKELYEVIAQMNELYLHALNQIE